jgi:hypothetical protein
MTIVEMIIVRTVIAGMKHVWPTILSSIGPQGLSEFHFQILTLSVRLTILTSAEAWTTSLNQNRGTKPVEVQ